MSKKQKPTGNTGRKNQIKGKYAERSRKNGFGKFCLILQVIMSAAFMGVLVLLDMLPLKYLALAALILFFLWCITFTTQAVRKKKGVTGKVYSILLIAVLAVGTYYIAKTNDMIAAITSGGSKVDKMVVAVLKDDPAETLEDASDYEFGVQFNTGAENMLLLWIFRIRSEIYPQQNTSLFRNRQRRLFREKWTQLYTISLIQN